MISRMTFCSAQPAMIRPARLGPIPLTSRLDAQHAKPVLLVMERGPLDEAGQNLRRRARLCSLEHAHEPLIGETPGVDKPFSPPAKSPTTAQPAVLCQLRSNYRGALG